MRIGLDLEDGPPHKQSVSDASYGKTQPPQLQAVEGHKVLCIKTGRTFIQSNLDEGEAPMKAAANTSDNGVPGFHKPDVSL
jgi:hypothetical protein